MRRRVARLTTVLETKTRAPPVSSGLEEKTRTMMKKKKEDVGKRQERIKRHSFLFFSFFLFPRLLSVCVCVLCGPRQRWNAECRRPLEALLSFSCVVYVCVCVLPPFCPIPGRLPVFPTSSTEKSSFFFLSFFSFLLYHLDSPALGVIAAHVDIKLCFFLPLSLFFL